MFDIFCKLENACVTDVCAAIPPPAIPIFRAFSMPSFWSTVEDLHSMTPSTRIAARTPPISAFPQRCIKESGCVSNAVIFSSEMVAVGELYTLKPREIESLM